MCDTEAYCILISDTETFTHTYKLIPECAHTNIVISGKCVLSGMDVQKTDADRSVRLKRYRLNRMQMNRYPNTRIQSMRMQMQQDAVLPRTTQWAQICGNILGFKGYGNRVRGSNLSGAKLCQNTASGYALLRIQSTRAT